MSWDSLNFNSWISGGVSLMKLFSWTLILLCFSASKIASTDIPQPPPNPTKDIEIAHKFEGDSAILSCIVKDLGRRKIIWTRLSDPYPISVGTLRFHPDRKYRVENQANTNVLTIRGVGLADSGEYQCKVSGSFPLTEVISLNIESGKKSTHFLPTNRTLVAHTGMTVELPCKVDNLNAKMVMWKDGRNNMLTLRKRVYNGDKRLSIIHKTKPDWHLKIENLTAEDFGFYTCVVNYDPVLTRTVELINEEPPKIAPVIMKDSNFRRKIEVMVGETVTMTCNFHAYPPAEVKWYKREKVEGKYKKTYLSAKGNEYTLQSVTLGQAGDYVCIGRNGMKEGKAKTRLIVKAPPTTVPTTVATTTFIPTKPTWPHLYWVNDRVGQRKGRNAELKCFAIGQPRPKVHWMRHGSRIMSDHKYKLTNKSHGRYTANSTLLIRAVSTRDFGSYECVGNNELGLKKLPFVLYELKT